MAANSIPISIDLQLAGLKEQLASIPGLTADAATKMLKEVVSAAKAAEKASKASMEALRKAATSATDEAADAARSVEGIADASGDAGSAAGRLAGAFSMISPGAGEAARSVADLADVAEVAAQALMGVGKTGFAGLLTTLGPLAIAIGVATAAFAAYQAETEAAKEATEAAKEAAENAATAYSSMTDALFRATVRQKELRGELTASQAAAALAGQDVAKEFLPPITEAAQRLEVLKGEAVKLEQQLGSGGLGTGPLRAKLEEAQQAVEDQRAEVARLSAQYTTLYDVTVSNTTATEAIRDTTRGAAKAQKRLNDELKTAEEYWFAQYAKIIAAEKALDDLRALIIEGELAPGTRDIRNATEAYAGLTLAWDDASKSADDVKMWQADLVIAFSRGGITLAEFEAGVEKVRKQLLLLSRTKMAALFERFDIGTVIQGFQAAESGLEGIATMIGGPVAGAIAGIVLNLEDTVGTIREQLASLPQILESAPGLLADLLVDLVGEVIPALMEAVPRIAEALALAVASPEFIAAIVKLNAMIFNPATGLKIGIEIARGLWDAFVKGWESFVSGQMARDVKWALVDGMVEAVGTIREFFRDLVEKLRDILSFDGDGAQKTGDVLREIFSLGQKQTQTYGDSPGVVRAGPQGMNVRVAPNDYIAAHRTREGLGAMAGSGAAVPMAPVYLDLASGHAAWDGMLARQIRLGGQATVALRQAGRTGRKAR